MWFLDFEMENLVNTIEDVESDFLNEMLGFDGNDRTQDSLLVGGGIVASRHPSDLSLIKDSTLEDLAEDMVFLTIDRQQESIRRSSGAPQSI
ncbi:hypothetical protein GIB67_005006 [Kingdonia uniflora]|uniref:Uncharacterized protein n=1 Tax=Kingdonia uniflora TaxID=39325 RepID=A0A7J7NN93_9MAGN|nr:hypothetical protein GIB67_005006 [Kingdonia uniflora]